MGGVLTTTGCEGSQRTRSGQRGCCCVPRRAGFDPLADPGGDPGPAEHSEQVVGLYESQAGGPPLTGVLRDIDVRGSRLNQEHPLVDERFHWIRSPAWVSRLFLGSNVRNFGPGVYRLLENDRPGGSQRRSCPPEEQRRGMPEPDRCFSHSRLVGHTEKECDLNPLLAGPRNDHRLPRG